MSEQNRNLDSLRFATVINGVRRLAKPRINTKQSKIGSHGGRLPSSLKGKKSSSLRSVSFESIHSDGKLPGYASVDNPNLIGVVMPMGHGKSHYRQEGWLDLDTTLGHSEKEKMIVTVADEMVRGNTYDDAIQGFVPQMSAVLRMMDIDDRVLVLSNSHSVLKALGIPISATLILHQDEFEANISGRSEWEKNLARANRSVCQLGYRGEHVIEIMNNQDMHATLYQMCEIMEIPTAQPLLYSEEDYDPVQGAGDGMVDIEDAYQRYREGDIPYQCLAFQIKNLGLDTYKYMGLGINDWTECCARIVTARGKVIEYPEIVQWPLRLQRMLAQRVITPCPEADMIVKAHEGEPERFINTLLLHWEMSGRFCDRSILPMYLVRLSGWNSVHSTIRGMVKKSGTLFGKPLFGESRAVVLNMIELGLCSRSALRTHKILSGHVNTNSACIKPNDIKKIYGAIKKVTTSRARLDLLGFRDLISESLVDCVRDTAMRVKKGEELTNIEAVCCSYFTYSHEERCVKLSKIENMLSGLGPIDHPWDNMVSRQLEKIYGERSALSRVLCWMGPDWIEKADMGTEMIRTVNGLVTQIMSSGYAAVHSGVDLGLCQDKGTGRLLVIPKAGDLSFWEHVGTLNLGSNASVAPGAGLSQVAKAGNLVDWGRSLIGLALEFGNADQWLGSNTECKDKVALLSWWITFIDQFPSRRRAIESVIDVFCRDWFGTAFNRKVEGDIRAFSGLSRRCGGLGCGDLVLDGWAEGGSDWIPGRGLVEISGVKRSGGPKDESTGHLECSMDEEASHKIGFWSATSLAKIGPLMSMVLRCSNRSEQRDVADTMDVIVRKRIKQDNLPKPLRVRADEVEEAESE